MVMVSSSDLQRADDQRERINPHGVEPSLHQLVRSLVEIGERAARIMLRQPRVIPHRIGHAPGLEAVAHVGRRTAAIGGV